MKTKTHMNITNKEKLTLQKADAITQRLRDEKTRQEVNALRKLAGRCFRYQNSYGCGDKKGPWWLWLRVDRIEEDGGFRGLSFEVDNIGRVTVKPNEWHINLHEGYSEVTADQYAEAFLNMMNGINSAYISHAR